LGKVLMAVGRYGEELLLTAGLARGEEAGRSGGGRGADGGREAERQEA